MTPRTGGARWDYQHDRCPGSGQKAGEPTRTVVALRCPSCGRYIFSKSGILRPHRTNPKPT